MPSKMYFQGDNDPLWLSDDADQVVRMLEEAPDSERFLRLEQVPYLEGEASRPAYIKPCMVTEVQPLDPRELAYEGDLPEWLRT